MALPLVFKSFPLLFESRDIINFFLNLFFSVRTVSYRTSFSRALRACAINPSGKSSVRILQYGPRTRLVRGMCDMKLVLSNLFETRASLDSLN